MKTQRATYRVHCDIQEILQHRERNVHDSERERETRGAADDRYSKSLSEGFLDLELEVWKTLKMETEVEVVEIETDAKES